MARKRIGYVIVAKERNEVQIEIDLFERNDPEKEVLRLALEGDTTGDAYKAALAACKELKEGGAKSTRGLFRKVTSCPLMLVLRGASRFSECVVTHGLNDSHHRKILSELVRKEVGDDLLNSTRANIGDVLATANVGIVENVSGGMCRLTVETDDTEEDDD